MPREIPESDWKVFRDLRAMALNRLCAEILTDVQRQTDRPDKTAHEKYLALYKLIHQRDKDIACAFNDFRRSTALTQLGIIHSQGLFTAEELLRFSPMTRENLALYAPIPEAEGLSPQPKRMED